MRNWVTAEKSLKNLEYSKRSMRVIYILMHMINATHCIIYLGVQLGVGIGILPVRRMFPASLP